MGSKPKHVALIMDGNGRWANAHALPRIKGHYAGAKIAESVVEYALADGIEVLTLFAFGLDNLARPPAEIEALFCLVEKKLRALLADLCAKGVRFRMLGDRTILPKAVREIIEASEQETQQGSILTLNLALNFSGQWHIASVASRLAADRVQITPQSLDAAMCEDCSPPDLLIRTSGEQRLSNFMLWHLAYTELVFMDVYWPDFTHQHWQSSLQNFSQRDRRFGGIEVKHV